MAFEAFLASDAAGKRSARWRRLTYTLSLSLHAGLVLLGVGYSFWRVEEIQPPGVAVTLLTALPPPAPPPPAAPAKAAPAKPKTLVEAARPRSAPPPVAPPVMQPRDRDEPPPAEAPDPAPASVGDDEVPASAAGIPGGSGAGSPAGVAAGAAIVATPPPPAPAPLFLPPSAGTQQRISDIEDARFRPTLPAVLKRPGRVVWGLFRICVGTAGQVEDVRIMKSADPLVDNDWIATIRRWQYRPYEVSGRPVPFCHAARIEIRAEN